MSKDINEIIKYVRDNKFKMIDLKFINLFGGWHHLTCPADRFNSAFVDEGIPFDGSSIPGFKSVEAGDMVLIPDLETMQEDPFWEQRTLSFICNSYDAGNFNKFENDPRYVAFKAEEYLKNTLQSAKSLWAPEFEYYIFDSINYKNDINLAFYQIDSVEADWNSSSEVGKNLGYKIPRQGGYHAIPPMDTLFNIRAKMVEEIESSNIPVRYHHHEVGGPGQSEIEILKSEMTRIGDYTMWIKYIIKMVAARYNKTVTFMPKPLYNEAGSGMHFHQGLFDIQGNSLFYDKNGPAGLSQLALYYIGGLLHHGRALVALTNPSTISYKRLLPGFEAPVKLFFGEANRSAAIRIPKYSNSPKDKIIEFRPPDATCNIYLALAAQLLAGLDGIKKKIDPVEKGWGPININIGELKEDKLKEIISLPSSLNDALNALIDDNDFLLADNVFSKKLLETWIDYKMKKEYYEVRYRPHPYEINLYFDV